jgi:hypothetical protein
MVASRQAALLHPRKATRQQPSRRPAISAFLLALCLAAPTANAQESPLASTSATIAPSSAAPPSSSAGSGDAATMATSTAVPVAAGTIWSTAYTLRFPLPVSAQLSELAPASYPVAQPQSSSAPLSPTSISTRSAQSGQDVSPIMSFSTLPSLRIATVTDIWWSPVQGQGGPGIPARRLPGPWSKYDRIVVAHAVMGSLAWLIVCTSLRAILCM